MSKLQLGKNKVTDSFISAVKSHFKRHKTVRISVLKNAFNLDEKKKETVKRYSEEILKKLGNNFSAKIIGFTIILKKRKPKKVSDN